MPSVWRWATGVEVTDPMEVLVIVLSSIYSFGFCTMLFWYLGQMLQLNLHSLRQMEYFAAITFIPAATRLGQRLTASSEIA